MHPPILVDDTTLILRATGGVRPSSRGCGTLGTGQTRHSCRYAVPCLTINTATLCSFVHFQQNVFYAVVTVFRMHVAPFLSREVSRKGWR